MSNVTVRRATVADAAALARLMGHPEVFPQLLQLPFTDEEVWKVRLAESTAPGRPELVLVAEVNGEVVGNAGLHPVGPQLRRRHAMFMGIAVAPHAHRQGVGTALLQALCDYADQWAQVLRIELTVFVDNEPAIALYRRHGFEHEGTHRAFAMRGGRYVDVLSMARLHPSPPQLQPLFQRGGH
ncbi:MAG TPA: GNAT family N-acetyltransferase [Burkholderiaceae bacterium]|nr:GNAT family N-acetyltransferase [Burkholderiaceae bacterium]